MRVAEGRKVGNQGRGAEVQAQNAGLRNTPARRTIDAPRA